MLHFYETAIEGEIQAHGSLEEAIAFADKNNCPIISEVGGNWSEWQKCTFCNDWFDSCELNIEGHCEICEMVIKDHCKY